MARETPDDQVEAEIRIALRTSMCPVCRCIGTTRLYKRSQAQDQEIVCLRCGTDLALETGARKLVPLRVAKIKGVRPAGDPRAIVPGVEISLSQWLELAKIDEAFLKKTAEEVSVRPRTGFKPPQWKAEFDGRERNPFAFVGAAALVVLLVVPLLWMFQEIDAFVAATIAGTAAVITVTSFLLAGKPEEPEGRVTLSLLVAQENERHLMSALEAVLAAAKVKVSLPRDRTAPIASVTYGCESDSFTIRFARGADPGNPNLLYITIEPVTRENERHLEHICQMLTNMFVEIGFHLLPIPASQGGVVALER